MTSFVFSFILLIINLYVWYSGCENLQSPLNLPHGYLPVFPHHMYPSNQSKPPSYVSGLDHYLYSHIMHDSLNYSTPPVVHIIHCDSGPFTFPHFLSVVAAFKVFKPSAMYLHVKREPELDPDAYFQFLPDLIRDIPILVKLKLDETRACSSKGKDQVMAYIKVIGKNGGIAINSRTVISPSDSLSSMANKKISTASFEADEATTLIVSLAAQMSVSLSSLQSLLNSPHGESTSCSSPASFSIGLHRTNICLYVNEDLFPFQIFKATSDFASLARWAGYGTTGRLTPYPSSHEIVPNIVHYVWLGKRRLDFFSYLSLLSGLYVLEADTVYIHGEPPHGELWERIKKEPRLKLIRRDIPEAVYGSPIKKFLSHASDYLRADILLRYGGVYADIDVIFLQKLPPVIRRYKTSACVDWPITGAFPDVFNMGVLLAAPGAAFLRYFLESYRWYLDGDWSYNAIHIPYKVYEKKPQTLNIARHIQVLCAEDKCHAAWIPDYKEDGIDHLDGKTFDWRKDALSIHWTHPDPKEFASHDALMASDSITADIGKMVLRKAKISGV